MIKNRCIYCLLDFEENGREHVPSKSFGSYGTHTWTLKQVYNPCNQKLGNEIDEMLARGSIEGWMRFRYNVLLPQESFSAKRQTV